MTMRIKIIMLLGIVGFILAACSGPTPKQEKEPATQPAPKSVAQNPKIDAHLASAVKGYQEDELVPVIIMLKPNSNTPDPAKIERGKPKPEKEKVAEELRSEAQRAHKPFADEIGRQKGVLKRDWWIINAVAAEIPASKIEKLSSHPEVETIYPDGENTTFLVNSTAQIGSDKVNVPSPPYDGSTYDGSGVTIALIDSGIDLDHPAFTGRIVRAVDLAPWDLDGNNPQDKDGHGTLDAGIAAGTGWTERPTLHGVAPGANIISEKAERRFWGTSKYMDGDIIEGLQDAVAHGAKVINVSLGAESMTSKEDHPVQRAYDSVVYNNGVVVVLAAGNRNFGNGGAHNGSISNVSHNGIVVGSVGQGDYEATTGNLVASFSGRGPTLEGRVKPDVVAPGGDISPPDYTNDFSPTTNDDSDPGHKPPVPDGMREDLIWGPDIHGTGAFGQAGTSQAAPHVAGVAALLLQAKPDLSPEEIKAVIVNSAVNISNLPGNIGLTASDFGYGRVNAIEAINTVTANDRVVSGSLLNQGEASYYQITVSQNETIELTLAWNRMERPNGGGSSGSPSGAFLPENNLDLVVYNSSGEIITQSVSTVNNVEHVQFSTGSGGVFYIKVKAFSMPTALLLGVAQPFALASNFPLSPNPDFDSDGDGLPNAWETKYGCMQSLVADNLIDYDFDGLNNECEYIEGTNPCDSDSDNGGESDGSELANGRNPFDKEDDSIINCADPLMTGSEFQISFRIYGNDFNGVSSSIVWTGSEYGVIWVDGFIGELYFARISQAGEKIGSDLQLGSCCNSLPILVWTGSEYAASWKYAPIWPEYDYILFLRISFDGVQIGDQVLIDSSSHEISQPSMVWTGSEFGLSTHKWFYTTGPNGSNEIVFSRISSVGDIIGSNVRITNDPNESSSPSLVWTGSEYGVSWNDNRDGNYEIYFARVYGDGTKIDNDIRITSNYLDSLDPSLVWTGSEYGVSWSDNRAWYLNYIYPGGSYGLAFDIYFARVSSTGAKIENDVQVTDHYLCRRYYHIYIYDLGSSRSPYLIWTSSGYAVGFQDFHDGCYGEQGGGGIYFATISSEGGVNKVNRSMIINNNYLYSPTIPSLAWTGSEFGMSWNDERPETNYEEEIYFARIGCGDEDGMPNDWESSHACMQVNTADSQMDYDADGLNNITEYFYSTDPCDADSDNDGISDGNEVSVYLSDPLLSDSDGDGLADGWEIANGLDPLIDDAASDPDNDGLINLREYQNNANPQSADSDGDGMADGWEIANSLNPHVNDAASDADSDGLTNLQEYLVNTNPKNSDTDSDGISDGTEVIIYGTDPLDPDSDYDGLIEGDEINVYGSDPLNPDSDGDGLGDGIEASQGQNPNGSDTDGDGLTDDDEINIYGTDPLDPDSDDDTLLDGNEVLIYSTNPLNPDTDGDIMDDAWEVSYVSCLDPVSGDSLQDGDTDGLTNLSEYNFGTQPCNPDTDNDGMWDGWEVTYISCMNPLVDDLYQDQDGDWLYNYDEYFYTETNPCDPDTDDDGLMDWDESYWFGTNPSNPDTDGDGMDDGWEINNGLNALSNDASGDADGDGLTNLQEYQNATNPQNSDSDGDGLTDGQEVNIYGTNPLAPDTEEDGLPDGWEATYISCMNPLGYDLYQDPDDDLLSNGEEYFYIGTDPCDPDTEGDGMPDGWEASYNWCGLDPLWNDSAMDDDNDGLANILEYGNSTDPCNPDSDNDGLSDGDEVNVFSADPLDPDTDDDGMMDGWEASYNVCGLNLLSAADALADPDHDGLKNLAEYNAHSNPCDPDTDDDGLGDRTEVTVLHTNPASSDTDADGLWDGAEVFTYHTSPLDPDSDDDMLSDGDEVNVYHTLPLDPDTDNDGLLDGEEVWIYGTSPTDTDSDDDGLLDGDEVYLYGTNPARADTDGDWLSDRDEIFTYFTSPVQWDTDNDMLADGEEVLFYGTNPVDEDTDGDGLGDGDEIFNYGTSALDPDTDGDAMPDGWEVQYSSCVNPLLGDALSDPDADSLTNLAEYQGGTNPCVSNTPVDSDGDGLTDTLEVSLGTNPNDPDSDHDGVNDGAEYNTYHTNPLAWDTDGDALPDGYEVAHLGSAPALDPLNLLDGAGNYDSDPNSNVHEYWNGSDPWAANPVGAVGCFFWADAGSGDGIVSPGDAIELKKAISGGVGNYTGVIPNSGETHELDMDGYISPLDLIILQKMIQGSAIGPLGSRPTALVTTDAPGATVSVGFTTHVTVSVRNEAAKGTPGFGVIFEIVSASSTATATFLGGEGTATPIPGSRYDISGPITPGGLSRIVLRMDSAGTLTLRARVPACGLPGIGRSSSEIILDPAAVVIGQ